MTGKTLKLQEKPKDEWCNGKRWEKCGVCQQQACETKQK